jgi:hypothetical protein
MKLGKLVPLLIFSLAIVLAVACKPRTSGAANSNLDNKNASASLSSNSPTKNQSADNMHSFRGSIDDNKFTMWLTRDGDQITGTYSYQKIGKDIQLKGTVDGKNALTMQEFGDGSDKVTGVFKGTWTLPNDSPFVTIEGTWGKSATAKETLSFWASEEVVDSTLKIETAQIKEESKKPKFEAFLEYPRIVGSTNPNAEKFNALMKSEVTKGMAAFKKDLAGQAPLPPEISEMGNSYDTGYSIYFANDDLISVQMVVSTYSAGAAHGSHQMQVYNYNLKDGREWKLSDLFMPGAKYLQALSKYSTDNLLKRLKPEGEDGLCSDADWVKKGAEPTAEAYRSWNISKKGLVITFGEYEVACYAGGPQYVNVPYSELKSIVRANGPIAGR